MGSDLQPAGRDGQGVEIDAVAHRVAEILIERTFDAVRVDRPHSHLLRLADAAALARCSTRTLRRAVRAGRLRAVQPAGRGGRVFITLGDLERWLFDGAGPPVVQARRGVKRHRDNGSTQPPRISLADVRPRPSE